MAEQSTAKFTFDSTDRSWIDHHQDANKDERLNKTV